MSKTLRAIDCSGPENTGIADPCFVRPAGPKSDGWFCIYCVNAGRCQQESRVRCTIEIDVSAGAQFEGCTPCAALSQAGGIATSPAGYRILPDPGMFDVFGDGDPFLAGGVPTGSVKYYLQPVFRGRVDPKMVRPPEVEQACEGCGWLCNYVKHYLTPGKAWEIVCTDVLLDQCNSHRRVPVGLDLR